MSDGLARPAGIGLAVGAAFIVLISALTSQVPYIKTSIEFSKEVPIDVLSTIIQPASGQQPYAVVDVNKSKEIIISNSGWGAWLRHTKTLMTIDKITIYPNDRSLQERLPDTFAWKSEFFVLIINYTMKNLDDQEYYPIADIYAIDQDGERYGEEIFPGEMGMILYPGESRRSWFGLQIPQDADEVTLEVRDSQTNRKLWTLEMDMQPFGQKPSDDNKFRPLPDDFALIYSYGYAGDITLDTKNGVVTMITCDDPPLYNVSLSLSKEQLTAIWHTVLENDFFNLPDFTGCPYPLGGCVQIIPERSAMLKITAYNQTHIVQSQQSYAMNLGEFNSDFAKYSEITTMLEEIVSKAELPRSNCAYL